MFGLVWPAILEFKKKKKNIATQKHTNIVWYVWADPRA